MKPHHFLVPLLALWLTACATKPAAPAAHPVKRYAMVTGLKPEKEAYYRELHAHPWPSVIKTIRDCNIRNFSIFRAEIGGKPYLFAYFEYVGDDFEADMQKMADDPETQRWWKETDPCQIPLPEAAKQGKIWTDAEEIFWTP
jgi:L-rhamnose mutarotase